MDLNSVEGGEGHLQKWLLTVDQPRWKVVVLAVLVVLLFALMLFVAGGFAAWNAALKAKLASPERFGNGSTAEVGQAIGVTAANAFDGRVNFSQVPSATNQGGYNDSLTTAVLAGNRPAERLTATNSAPDFWTVSDELGRSQDQDRVGRGDLGENQYWSPDLQLWLTSSEVKQLPADQAAKVQYYGNQAVAPAGQVAAAAVERMRNSNAALLQERMRNSNASLTPEERMMSDMISREYRDEHLTVRSVEDSLMSRLGSGM